jgi:hypothetical protein
VAVVVTVACGCSGRPAPRDDHGRDTQRQHNDGAAAAVPAAPGSSVNRGAGDSVSSGCGVTWILTTARAVPFDDENLQTMPESPMGNTVPETTGTSTIMQSPAVRPSGTTGANSMGAPLASVASAVIVR